MEHKEVTTWVLASIFILFLLFSLYRPDLNLKDISGKIAAENSLPSTNLVLRFDFEENSGSTVNDLALNHDGTINGASWADGKYGKALSFDGVSNSVSVNDAPDIRGGNDWTVTAWFKSELNGKIILSKGGDYQIEISSNGVAKCSYVKNGINSVSSTNYINLNSWNFVACSNKRTTKTLNVYLNGIKNQATQTNDNQGSATSLQIGNGINYFKGSIDSVRIYNAVLSDADISTIYNFAYCGNGIKEETESCDGTDKGTSTCGTQGFSGGTLNCNSDCTFDTSQCTNCGNAIIDAGEQCDGTNLGGQTCASQGSTGSGLSCSASCTFDTSTCNILPPTLSLANISNKIYVNSNLIGDISFTTSNTISNNSNVTLNLSTAGYSLFNVISLQEYMDYLNKQGTQSANEINYPAGTYSLEASKFNLIPNVVNNTYTLSMSLTTPQNQKYSASKSLSIVYVENALTAHNVTFYNSNGATTFSKGNFINCSIAVTDEKGFGSYNYKIWGPTKSVNEPDYSNSLSCTGSGLKYCSASINATIARKGNWTCGIAAANASNSYSLASLKNLTMVNSMPILKSNIPNKTWSGGILNNAIDLKNYFEDPDGDSLNFNYTGNVTPIKINISASGVVNLNTTTFIGSRNVYFSANDGVSSINSNTILLNVTGSINITGNATAGCVPDWDTGNWSDCMSDGKQFRIILDSNGCNNETGKPLDEQSCVYQSPASTGLQTQQPASQAQQGIQISTEEKGLTKEQKILYSGILLGFFVLLAVVVILISKFKGKKSAVQVSQKPKAEVRPAVKLGVKAVTPIAKIEPVKVRVKEAIQPANLEAMRDYSVKMIEKGAESSKVKEALEKAGWPKDGIENAVNYAVLYNFAKKKLAEGMSKERIKSMLIAKKWSIDLVNEIINRL